MTAANPFKPRKGSAPNAEPNRPPKVPTGKVRVNVNVDPRIAQAAQEKYPDVSLAKAVEMWLAELAENPLR